MRLTVMDEPATSAPVHWTASGLEPVNGTWQFFSIPTQPVGQQWLTQLVSLTTSVNMPYTFQASLAEDIPAGTITALDNALFAGATDTAREQALEALATSLNPLATTVKTVQCSDCHVSTYVAATRAAQLGIAVDSIPGTFTSSHDLSIAAGASATDYFSLRAFGWRGATAEISQRVANDTAMVLDEMEARFPPTGP
jgi:hypothetical protein